VVAALRKQSQPAPLENDRPLITSARLRSTRERLGRRMLLIWTIDVEDGSGHSVATHVMATTASLARLSSTRSALKEIVAQGEAALSAYAGRASRDWQRQVSDTTRRFVATRLDRERAIQSSLDSRSRSIIQPGLFDRRADHAEAADRAAQAEASEAIAGRIAHLESMAALGDVSRPRLRLILVP